MDEPTTVTRREFIRTTAVTGAALGMGLHSLGQTRPGNANERIVIGVIGVGGMGSGHLQRLVDMSRDPNGRVSVAAVCDIYEPRKQRAKEVSGAELYHDYRKMLDRKDIDAVLIASPDHWHAQMSVDAMESGKDVYCEKPMTLTWQEAKWVRDTARRTKKVVQIGAQSASEDRWWQARRLIEGGCIGKLLWTSSSYSRNSTGGEWNYWIDPACTPETLDWRAFLGKAKKRPFSPERYFRFRKYWDYSGGIATDLFYHQLAHLMVALGPEFPKRVVGMGGIYVQKDREVPDTFHMIVDYPSDHTLTLISSMANSTGVEEVICGHEATLRVRGNRAITQVQDEFKSTRKEFSFEEEPRADHLNNWLDCIKSREEPHCGAELGYKTMVAIGLGVESYRKGKMMHFDPRTETVIG